VALLIDVRQKPVSRFFAVTVAAPTTAPDVSKTIPDSFAPTWEDADGK
jgi:hypothetical protein